MSSLLRVGIEGFHCIQRCPHFRGLEWRGPTVYRGVLIIEGWNRGVPLYTEVSSLLRVGIEGFHCIQRCLCFRGIGVESTVFTWYASTALDASRIPPSSSLTQLKCDGRAS